MPLEEPALQATVDAMIAAIPKKSLSVYDLQQIARAIQDRILKMVAEASIALTKR